MPINFFTAVFIMIISMSAYSAENTTKTVPKEVADGSHLSANGNTTSTDDGGSERKYIDVDGPIGTSTDGTPTGTLTPSQPMGTKSSAQDCINDPACDPIEEDD